VSALIVIGAACSQNPAAPSDLAATGSSAGQLAARGGNRPPTEVPVTAAFRCPGALCSSTDRITGDGTAYDAMLDSQGNLRLTLSDPGRSVTFDYSECLAPCPYGSTGRRWFTTVAATGANRLLIHTSVLVPGTENETPRGFFDIPVGATWYSRIKIGFAITSPTGASLVWGMRYNPFYPGSTNLHVTRISDSAWFVEASSTEIAIALSAGETKRDGPEVFEGNYLMPFRINVTLK